MLTHYFTEVKLGALYNPRTLYDYGGPLFVHHFAKLKQRNIVDISGSLVPPWLEYDKLRTGTVVLMRVTLHTYDVPLGPYKTKKVSPWNHPSRTSLKDFQIYQIYADRVKILAPSQEAIEIRAP